MSSEEFWKIVSVFVSCGLFFGKIGMPAAVALFKFNFWKSICISCAGGITSTVIFTYTSEQILNFWNRLKERWFKKHSHPRTFTRTNRLVVKVKRRFGLLGIALLSPILLSIPVGAFLGERFYRDKRKVIIYLSGSVIFWSITLYFLFLFFYKTFESWFH